MPHRPPKKKKKTYSRVPGCISLRGDEAIKFLQDQGLWSFMEEKREKNLDDAKGQETVTISIGTRVRYGKANYIAHVYCIDNFEEEDTNGWLLHLWHPNLVIGNHKSYRQYINQFSADLEVDLNKVSV